MDKAGFYQRRNISIIILITLLIGITDIYTTTDFKLYQFYIVPIFFSVYFYGKLFGFIICILSYSCILYSDYMIDGKYSLLSIWNDSAVVIIYIIFIFIINEVKKKNQIEKEKEILKEKVYYLDNTLKQRNLLIREMYHRLKNNINELISFITLHEIQKDGDIIDLIRNKLYVYSTLFNKLCYDFNDDTEVDLYEFTEDFIKTFTETVKHKSIKTSLNKFEFEADHALTKSIGLLLNELLTNSVKYAYNDSNTLKIDINIFQDGNILKINYKDSGQGFDFNNINTDDHLGFFIINSIVKEYKGRIEYKIDNGSNFYIELVSDKQLETIG